ncbi:MAG: PAS domain-containing protein [Limisphaerales bacterium]
MKENCAMQGPGPMMGAEADPLPGGEFVPPGQDVADVDGPLRALLENSPDAVYFKDRGSRFVHFSKFFSRLWGVDNPESIRGKTDFDFFTEEHARPAFNDEQEIIRTGTPVIGKMEKETHPDGRVTWALTTKMPWRNAKGETVGIFGISKDVTTLKQAEDKLANERELWRTLLDNIPDRIYFKDRESRFVHFSKSFVTFHNIPPHEIIGKTDADLFAEEHAREALEDEHAILRTGKPLISKMEKETHSSGQVTWALTSKMPWRDGQGNVIGTFGISKDVTPLKIAEGELENAHQRLVETSRLAGMAEVASDVLHNVGNTLNSVNVSCSLVIDAIKRLNFDNLARIPPLLEQNTGRLEEFLTTDARGKHIPQYLAAIHDKFEEQKGFFLLELGHLREHINHINQIVAMEQSYAKVAGVQEVVDVARLVEDAIQINAAALQRHTIQYHRDIEPLPQILVDKHKVLQILINLIRNAKYALSESQSPQKLMTLRVRRTVENQAEIQVIDNGVGIPAENITRIFSHGFTTRRDGHGFGLHSGALAARELGGSLCAQSAGPGHGATFTLILPFKPPTAG